MARFGWLLAVLAAAVCLAPSTAAAQAFADWVRPTAPVRPIGDSGVGGEVALMPTGTGDYELRASVVPGHRQLTWRVAHGACATWPVSDAARWPALAEESPPLAGNWQFFRLRVPRAWAEQPLVLVGHAAAAGAPRACADLPVGEARAREPAPGARPATSAIRAAPGRAVDGDVLLWPTPSGDFLVRADVVGAPGEVGQRPDGADNLLWAVGVGGCGVQLATGRTGPVLALGLPAALTEPGRATVSAVVPRDWVPRAPETGLYLHAFPNGGGPVVACADLPVRVALGPGRLPGTGGPTGLGLAALAGGALLAAGAALRGRLTRSLAATAPPAPPAGAQSASTNTVAGAGRVVRASGSAAAAAGRDASAAAALGRRFPPERRASRRSGAAATHNQWVRVLLLAMALVGLILVAPRDHVGAWGAGARALGGPPVLPRGWATDRLRRVTVEFPRVDRIAAKLTTQAEWSGASGTGPFPARPTRAPGSVPAVAAGPTPVVPADATERLVWVVAASGEVQSPFLVGRGSSGWGVLILDARTGEALGMAAGDQEPWPPSWDRVVDRSAGVDWALGPAAGVVVSREDAERRAWGGAGRVRSRLLPAAAAARAAGVDRLPAWLDPRRDVWLVAIRDERAGLAGDGYALVDARLGAVLVAGQAARIDAPD